MCEFFYSLYFDFKPVIRDTKALICRCGEHIVVRRTAVVGKVVEIENGIVIRRANMNETLLYCFSRCEAHMPACTVDMKHRTVE